MIANRIRRNENFVYIILWSIVLVFYVLHYAAEHISRSESVFSFKLLKDGLGTLVPLVFVFVINNYLLLPRLLMRDKIAKYVVAAIGLVAVAFIAQYYVHITIKPLSPPPFDNIAGTNYIHPGPPKHHDLLAMPLINGVIYSFMVIGINIAVSMMFNYMNTRLEKEHLVTINTQNRLNHLKEQINPHFYLNMLNNIHGLIDLDPDKAKDMVYDMAQLMRYMLYDSDKDVIPLSSEVNFLNDYIRVMRQRYPTSKVSVTVSLPPAADVEPIKTPPLLFLVFIENAFKYGVDYRSNSFIDISLRVTDAKIIFRCSNSKHVNTAKNSMTAGGIGLQNIKTRLDIIYGGDALLVIDDGHDTFSVDLKLPIKFYK